MKRIHIQSREGDAMARKKLDTLTEQMYYLLLALHEPGHGYAIMERARELSHGRLQLGPGRRSRAAAVPCSICLRNASTTDPVSTAACWQRNLPPY